MGGFIDLTGLKFGKLTVIKRDNNKNGRVCWLCKCDCGNDEYVTYSKTLLNGTCKSCGCLSKDNAIKRIGKANKQNKYEFYDEYVIGFYEDGQIYYLDLKNYDKIKNYFWFEKDGYAYTVTLKKKYSKRISMHQLLFGYEVDHINGNRSDNRAFNIREVTRSENNCNSTLYKNNKTGVKGVSYHENYGYKASIQKDYKVYDLIFTRDFDKAILYREIAELYLFEKYSRNYIILNEKYKNIDIVEFIKLHMPKLIT